MSRLEWIKKIIMMVVIRVILGGKFMSEWNATMYAELEFLQYN